MLGHSTRHANSHARITQPNKIEYRRGSGVFSLFNVSLSFLLYKKGEKRCCSVCMCVKNICSPWRVGICSSISGARWIARFSSSRALVRCSLKPSRAELLGAARGKIRNRSDHFHTAALDMPTGPVAYRERWLGGGARPTLPFAQQKNIWLRSPPAALIRMYHTAPHRPPTRNTWLFPSRSPPNHIVRGPYSGGTKSTLASRLLPSCTFLRRHYKSPYYGTEALRPNGIPRRGPRANQWAA